MGPKGPESVEQKRDRRGDKDRQTLGGTCTETDPRVKNGKASVVEDERHGCDDRKTGQIALNGPSARGKGPDADKREVEEAVEDKSNTECRVRRNPNRELARIYGDRYQVATASDESVANDLDCGVLGWP